MKRRSLIPAILAALIVGVPSAGAATVTTPTITSSSPASPANNNSPVLTGTADPNAVVTIHAGDCSTPGVVTTPVDAAGAFQVAVPAPDDMLTDFHAHASIGSNDSACSASFPYLEDSTAPTTSLTSPPPVTGPDVSFSFAGSDAGSGVARFECQLDGGGFADCFSPKNYSGLQGGSHTFEVRAVDAAQNVDLLGASDTWTVDTVSPNVIFTTKPPAITNQTSATFAFASDKTPSTFECSLDGAAYTACSSPKLYTRLANGAHTVAVRANWLGLPGPPSQYSWTVDLVAPQTTIGAKPPPESTSATASFMFGGNEPSTFTCRLDKGGPVPCASPKTYSGLGDGAHTFSVQAVDRAGNSDPTPAGYSWHISGVGPPVRDLKPPANVRLKRSVGYRVLKLRWRRPRDPDFDHVAVFVSTKRGTPPRKLVYTGRKRSYVDRRFQNGQYHRYLVVSYDTSDNASGGASAPVPPSALLRSPRDAQVVRTAPLLRWARVRKATYYNIQLYYRGHKVLSVWPIRARQALQRRWTYSGRRYALRKGAYSWFVWPGFGPRAKSRYGDLLGFGTFKVR